MTIMNTWDWVLKSLYVYGNKPSFDIIIRRYDPPFFGVCRENRKSKTYRTHREGEDRVCYVPVRNTVIIFVYVHDTHTSSFIIPLYKGTIDYRKLFQFILGWLVPSRILLLCNSRDSIYGKNKYLFCVQLHCRVKRR